MKVVLPARGEFGLKLRYHVPAVHALAGPKVVVHEPGEEVLFPSADGRWVVPPVADDRRRGTFPKNLRAEDLELAREAERRYPGATVVKTKPGMPEARFVPDEPVVVGGPTDIVLCPRWRTYGSAKNWEGWYWLAAHMPTPFLAGREETSAPGIADTPRANAGWRAVLPPLRAAVSAMLRCKVVVATDAGLAHLAVLCGAPLLLVTYKGLVAPGPVIDGDGRRVHGQYWHVRLEEYYTKANHQNAPIWVVDGWEAPERVLEKVMRIVAGRGGP